jgi:hypothetical protein
MFPITLLNVHIQAEHPIDFGANPGSSIRGALYEALRVMYDDGSQVTSRHDAERNPVAWLLRLEDEQTSGGNKVPRPIAIRPPLENETLTATFGLAFYGYAHQYMNLVLSAISTMQGIGVGRGRQKFKLVGVDAVDAISHQAQPLIDAQGVMVGQLPAAPTRSAYENYASVLNTDHLTVRFITPTRIIKNKALCHTPDFRPWFQRLLERIRVISELYTDDPVWVPFRDLLAEADSVSIVEDQTHWSEGWSGSRRDGEMRPTSGFVGTVSYQGNFARLLPWLVLGQSLQVGKNTIKGSGWYQLKYQWR